MRIYSLFVALALASTAHATLTSIGTTTNGPLTWSTSTQFGSINSVGDLLGIEFTVPSTEYLYSLTVPLSYSNGKGYSDTVSFTLYTGSATPNIGDPLAVSSLTISPGFGQLYTFDFFEQPTRLTAGVTYFLVGSLPASSQFSTMEWFGSPAHIPVDYVGYSTGWSNNTVTPGPAWQVELDTPEPLSLALIAAGLVVLGVLRARRGTWSRIKVG